MLTQLRFIPVCLTIALAALAVALAGSQTARAVSIPVLIDGVVVEDGVAILTGAAEAELVEINGNVVQVGDDGTFSAPIDLGADTVVVEVLESPSELVTIEVPVDVLLATGGGGVLDDLIRAGISIEVPEEGFRIVDGQMPLIEGRVLNGATLASLEVNGRNVLRILGPGGLFAVGSSSSTSRETVTVVATDRRGVSQTSTFTATRVRSTIATRAGTSVSAAGARGIVIAKVAFDKRFLKPAKFFRVVVTVKDRRGYLIRGASLRMHALPSKNVANGAIRAAFTNRLGKAAFGYRLKAGVVVNAKHLTFAMRAATPKSSATKRVALRLPAALPR